MKNAIAVVVTALFLACGPQGEPGEQGEKGAQGDKGVKGDAGATGAVGPGISQSINYFCVGADVDATHDVYVFPDRSVITSCEVEWSWGGSASGFAIHRTGTAGAAKGACHVSGPGGSYAEFSWGGGNAGSVKVYGLTARTYALSCSVR
jgi:hypothetical protein